MCGAHKAFSSWLIGSSAWSIDAGLNSTVDAHTHSSELRFSVPAQHVSPATPRSITLFPLFSLSHWHPVPTPTVAMYTFDGVALPRATWDCSLKI